MISKFMKNEIFELLEEFEKLGCVTFLHYSGHVDLIFIIISY